MKKGIQIACVPDNWDASKITVTGLKRNGRAALPVTITANELPEPWLTVWHGLVDTLKGVAPGEWAATYISAELIELPIPEEAYKENIEEVPEPQPAVELTIHRLWDDKTTAAPVALTLADPAAVAFFNFLTTDRQ